MLLARPPQIAMLQGVSRTPRHQLIGGLGTGKTGAAILLTGARALATGGWPGLFVLAPLQVALAWRNELPRWRPDLKLSLVAGTAKERESAIKASADVYVMGYDNLPWLDKYGPKDWGAFGKQMVCDESQRLRGTRVHVQTSSLGKRTLITHKSGVQTGALARHAGDFPYWLNMTGTPCPNGLQNWWPQLWYIDGGHRLGNSFTAFEERWFARPVRGGDFAKPLPLPGAAEEITARIKDVVTVVRTEDYFKLDEPLLVEREVELPRPVMVKYRSMRDRMLLEIKEGLETRSITVQGAGAKIAKLLQIAAGFAYYRDEDMDPDLQQCEQLHTAKLDAVDSILSELDENLVIFYQHKAMLDMLQARFKNRLTVLDKKGVAQDDWNAGKIEILAVQYQRGGAGLSLQHGGRSMCFIEPTYRADDYEQACARLGPLRQLQSGYQRTVNIFHVLARGTEDRRVFNVPKTKIELQDLVIEMLNAPA